jgi:hypothetical protein
VSFYRDTIRTARKEHKCGLCHGTINIGEKYHDKAGNSAVDENVVYSEKECEACQPVIDEFMSSSMADEGYCDEYIQEWWSNEKCWECIHHYLPCEPNEWCKDFFPVGAESVNECKERSKYGTCKVGDTCDDMTHYCRCEKYEKEEPQCKTS